MNNHAIKFLADAMLGSIAKKLRLMGFDTLYLTDRPDDELITIIQDEDRMLITKDAELGAKAAKLGLQCILLDGQNMTDNFLQIKDRAGVKNFSISAGSARCTICNGRLDRADKNKVREKIPDKVYEIEDDFWQCSDCQKIYWAGTHIQNLQNFVRDLNDC